MNVRQQNISPPSPYNMAINSFLLYHTKGMCNGHSGQEGDHKLHTAEQDSPLVILAVTSISIPGGGTA